MSNTKKRMKDPNISNATPPVAASGECNVKPRGTAVPVAVIGVGALFPGSAEPGGFWRDILNGRDMITEVPENYWLVGDHYDPDPLAKDKCYAKNGAFLSPTVFNPMEFGIPPTNLSATDTAQLLSLVVAKQVLNDAAGGQFKAMNKDRISVVLGVAAGLELLGEIAGRLQRPYWVKALREEGISEDRVNAICERILSNIVEWKESTFPGLLGNVVAGRIANQFDLKGMNCTSDAACASSFSAMKMALDELYIGDSEVVITGGVDSTNGPFLYTCFSKTPALSMTGDSRPFAENADGMILGEGIGMVALKRLSDAERDGDRIYAVIRGIGASSDGAGTSVYAPTVSGQTLALGRAYEAAGYGPETVELLEAHGTATIVGDKIEVEALNKVFNATDRKDRQWCALGSVKSQIGHTKSAAAIAGLIKAIMAVHHKVLPPTIKVNRPNPKFEIDKTPFYVNTKSRPWVGNDTYPRRASVSSFGFGGTNFHVTLEEYIGEGNKAYRMRTTPTELVLLTAKDSQGLIASCDGIIKSDTSAGGLLYYLARKSQEEFDSKAPSRLAIVAESEKDLVDKLTQARDKIVKDGKTAFSLPNGVFCNPNVEQPGDTAFLFAGQGSQYVDMGRDIVYFDPEAQAIWDFSARIPMDGETILSDVVFPKPVFTPDDEKALLKRLTQTEWAQPAICTTSLTLLDILRRMGITPSCVGGHSLGEVTALHAAGVIDREGLIRIARKRGELMSKASAVPGAMTAVAEPAEKIKGLLEKWKTGVIIANHNSPKQVVLSGALDDIAEVEKKLTAEGIKPHRLQVSTAFHSSLMTDACGQFKTFIDTVEFKPQTVTIYSNAEAKPYGKTNVRDTLTRQINHPVRFVEQIQAMYDSGVRTFIEVGPSSILTKLIGQCLEGRPHTVVSMDQKGAHGVTALWKAIGQLAVTGISMDFKALWASYAPAVEDPRTRKKPLMTVSISGYNYGRLYPPPGGAAGLPKPNPVDKTPAVTVTSTPKIQEPVAMPSSSQPMKKEAPPAKESVAVLTSAQPRTTPAPMPPKPVSGEKYYKVEKPAEPAMKSARPQTTAPAANRSAYTTAQASSAWLTAFREIQRHTAETYSTFQNSMAETQMAFIRNSEITNKMLGNMLGMSRTLVQEMPDSRYAHQAIPMAVGQFHTSDLRSTPPYPSFIPVPEVMEPVLAKSKTGVSAPVLNDVSIEPDPVDVPIKKAAMKPAAPAKPAPAAVPAPTAAPAVDYAGMIMNVVSDKTGYPKEILSFDMSLEADLGIDSIKRVEIFSAVKDENPWMPEVDPSEMGDIQTLGDVLEFIKKHAGAAQPSAAASAQVAVKSSAPAASPASGIDFETMLLDVVSDKTGYPKDILSMDMSLEADLGIDSIKRVEIFSAVKDENPWMPEVDPSEMGDIQTLGDVLAFIRKNAGAAPSATAPAPAASVPASAGIDFEAMLLDVVADKTGYPKDILSMDMSLEADLGIDSIKRVEIFSAVKDENPWMPEVDPSEMGDIQTLGDVLAFIQKNAGAASPAASTPVPSAAASPAVPAGLDLQEMLLAVVADKTGYPKDILTLEMGLESDLGIDSIKRVEIFSAVKDDNPWMPEVDPSEMGDIQTLGDVLEFIKKHAGAVAVASPAPATAAPSAATGTSSAVPSGIDLQEMLLTVVADKTGYPKDILSLDMGLESDLGIDSIKRVEIFSAVKDDNPWMPEVDPSEMGDIQTLGDVLEFIKKHAGLTAAPAPSQAQAATSAAPAADSAVLNIDFKKMLLDVVAEKTGYPVDILQMDMSLEADLGIDSIKRVEIFSAVKDENPWMPEVDPSEMGDIQTLGHVLEFIMNHARRIQGGPAAAVAETCGIDHSTHSGVGRYALREIPAPHTGFKMRGLNMENSIVIVPDENGVADALASLLKKRGLDVTISTTVQADADVVIFLGGLRDFADEKDAVAVNKEAFSVARTVAGHLTEKGGVFVTVQDTGGDFSLSGRSGHRAYAGGLPGLVKTARLEWPKASLKAIDIDRGGRSAEAIAEELRRELFTGGPDVEVGLHADGSRTILESYPADPNPSSGRVNSQSVIVASGGARGVTAATLIQLARQAQPKIVLLGRTAIEEEPACTRGVVGDGELKRALLEQARKEGRSVTPAALGAETKKILAGREISNTLAALSESGSFAAYVPCDVRDAASIDKALSPIREKWGAITGIVHGAGVLTDKLIAEKTDDQFDAVFNTKVTGLQSLLTATANDPVDMICLFSSIAGRSGNFGQCDYAMANEILNKVADVEKKRRNDGCVVKSINWGPWDGGMVSPLLKEYFEKMGVPLIPIDEGARRMVEEVMEADQASVEVVIGPCPPCGFFTAISEKHEATLHLMINEHDYPFIDNHRIKDEPVVPVAMVLEWFSRAAHACRPDLDVVACRDLTVLQGIKLNNFSDRGERLTCKCCQVSNGDGSTIEIEIPNSNGASHYKGVVEMARKGTSPARPTITTSPTGLAEWPWGTDQIYTDKLFHGPGFHVIKSLEGVSDNAATALLNGVGLMKWPGELWKTDAAAIDGGLQLAILWGLNQVGKKSLPTRIGSFYRFKDAPTSGPVYCELHGKIIDSNRSISDILFFDDNREIIAHMQGVEMHMLAS